MMVPAWVRNAVFYQVFPDRFADGDQQIRTPIVQPWGARPTSWGFQGGNLRGLIQKMGYFVDLGISALYLNPIFKATSNHRYNTTDYYRLDPMLGTEDDFTELLERAHSQGIRVILDGVFNHCGRSFFAFQDVLKNQADSKYLDWFHIKRLPIDAYSPGLATDYEAWWSIKSLPKFNTSNPEVRHHLLDVARHWIEMGADGWRLDVPNEIKDQDFWAEFRLVVKGANPDAYLAGEIWTIDPGWVGERGFDGLMNYPLRDAVLDFLAREKMRPSAFAALVERVFEAYPRQNALAHLGLLGTHDTPRLRTECQGDLDRVKLCTFFQFIYPGAPMIYYGDEIGMIGDADPDCRRSFPWEEGDWNLDLRRYVKKLIGLRRSLPALAEGDFRSLLVDDSLGVCAFVRNTEKQAVVAIINASGREAALLLPVGEVGWESADLLVDGLTGRQIQVAAGSAEVVLGPWNGLLLIKPS